MGAFESLCCARPFEQHPVLFAHNDYAEIVILSLRYIYFRNLPNPYPSLAFFKYTQLEPCSSRLLF